MNLLKLETMKNLIVTLSLLAMAGLANAQQLVIHAFARQQLVSLTGASIDSTVISPDLVYEVDPTHVVFRLDLGAGVSSYWANGVLLNELPIETERQPNGLLKIRILEPGLEYGLLVNADPKNESVTWFWFEPATTTVKIFLNFLIEKPA